MRVEARGFPYRRRTLDVGGHEMAYVDEGWGPPVVMVHGNPTWSFTFRNLIAALARDHRVIAPDHIGMGRSARPQPGSYDYTLEQRIRDLTSVIDALVPSGPVDLVVHDWGGAIGCGWATRFPERLGRLLVLNTAAFPLPDGERLPLALRLARSDVGALLIRYLGTFNLGTVALGAKGALSWPAIRGYLAPYRSPADREAVLAFVRDIPVSESDPAWEPLTCMAERLPLLHRHQVTVCWGLKDPVFTPRLLDEWRQRLPGAQIVTFPHAGHLVHEDAGAVIVDIARGLFSQEDASPGRMAPNRDPIPNGDSIPHGDSIPKGASMPKRAPTGEPGDP